MKGKGDVQVFVLDYKQYIKAHLLHTSSNSSDSPPLPTLPKIASKIDSVKVEMMNDSPMRERGGEVKHKDGHSFDNKVMPIVMSRNQGGFRLVLR